MAHGQAGMERLIGRVARRDRAAFLALYDATAAELHGLCLRILGDRAEAEDALHDVFVTVWAEAGWHRAGGLSPKAWLVTVARRVAIDRLRVRRPGAGGGAPAERRDPAPGRDGAEERILRCLAELPDSRAAAVRAAYLDGQSYRDLARRFGVPLNTMRTWLRRSLVALKECLSG